MLLYLTTNPEDVPKETEAAFTAQFGQFQQVQVFRKDIDDPYQVSNIVSNYLKSFQERNGVMLGEGLTHMDNPNFAYEFTLLLKAFDVKQYEPRNGIADVVIRKASNRETVSYEGPSAARRVVTPDLCATSDSAYPAQNLYSAVFISEESPVKVWTEAELNTAGLQWEQRRWVKPADFGIRANEIEPKASGKEICAMAEALTKAVEDSRQIIFTRSTFIIDPKADPAFVESLTIDLMNRGALVAVSERDENDRFVGFRILDTKTKFEREIGEIERVQMIIPSQDYLYEIGRSIDDENDRLQEFGDEIPNDEQLGIDIDTGIEAGENIDDEPENDIYVRDDDERCP